MSELRRTTCEAALETGDVDAMRAMLDPAVRWYREDGRLREAGSEAAMTVARARINAGVLTDARLTAWERSGDRLAVVIRLAGEEHRERALLCTIRDGRIVEVQDCASGNDALAHLAEQR